MAQEKTKPKDFIRAIIDEDLVKPEPPPPAGVRLLTIPATRIAEGLGRRLVANIVMLGFLAAVTDYISKEALKEAVRTSVPKGTEELNLEAFQKGYEVGKRVRS